MKDRGSKKTNIISFRMSDAERAAIQKVMDAKNKRASSVVREAFALFLEQWEMSHAMESSANN